MVRSQRHLREIQGIDSSGLGLNPTLFLSGVQLQENSPENTLVGVFSVLNSAATWLFTLTNSAGSRFKIISGNQLVVGVVQSNFETDGPAQFISVVATTVDEDPLIATFQIIIQNVSEIGFEVAATLQAASDTGFSNSDLITSDTTPTWDVAAVGGPWVVGDQLEAQADSGFGFVQLALHNIIAGDVTAGEVALTLSIPVEGAIDVRFRHLRAGDPGPWDEHIFTVDTTAPVLSSALGVPDTGIAGQATISVVTNELGGLAYYAVTASGTSPTATQIIAGQDHLGATADESGSVGATQLDIDLVITGVTQGQRFVHWVHDDTAGNRSAVISSSSWPQQVVSVPDPLVMTWVSNDQEPNPHFGFVAPGDDPALVGDIISGEIYTDVGLTALFTTFQNTLDSTEVSALTIIQALNLPNDQYWARFTWKHFGGTDSAFSNTITQTINVTVTPLLTAPSVVSTGGDDFDLLVTTDTAAGELFAVITQSPIAPSSAQLQLGQDENSAPAFFDVSQLVTLVGVQNIDASTPNFLTDQVYYAHWVHVAAAVSSNIVSSQAFGVGFPAALTATWATGPSAGNPDFDLEPPAGESFAVGDTIKGELYSDVTLLTLVDSFEVLLTPQIFFDGQFSETFALTDGDKFARFAWKHAAQTYSPWSVVISQVIGFGDTTPDAFTFVDKTSADPSTQYESNIITVAGVVAPANVGVSGGQYSKNGGAFTSAATTAVNTDTFKVRGTSSASSSGVVNVVLTIGGVSDTYSITTMDFIPTQFVFTDVVEATVSTIYESNEITVLAIDALASLVVSIVDGEYSKNAGAYTSAPGTAVLNDTFKVRKISAGVGDTTVSTTLTIGTISDTFSIATEDTIAPTLSAPTAAAVGSTTVNVGVVTNEGNGIWYWVLTGSATPPTAAQIKLGQDHLGAAALHADSKAVIATGVQSDSATGLTPSTTYHAHSMQEDAALNQSNVVTAASVVTTSGNFEVTWVDSAFHTNDVSAPNFGVVDLGAEDPLRVIAVALAVRTATGNALVAVATLHIPTLAADPTGTSLTKLAASESTTGPSTASIWYAAIPTGTQGELVIALSGGLSSRCAAEVYRLITGTPVPTAGANTFSGNGLSLNQSITIPASGGAIALYYHQFPGAGVTGIGWTNATEDNEMLLIETFACVSSAHTLADGVVSITAIPEGAAGNNSCNLALAAWDG